ncbi:MAG: hypothetical protein JWR24_35 [Actinoallomurus sp.]|jgi:hypothetical protein|nr:hypothetical protein [Actinoallomurus sp.]
MGSAAERRTSINLSSPVARLLLGPARSPGTLLDGGWWPRSADPVAELPGLVLALQGHGPPGDHGPITHILLRVSDWDSRPDRLRIEGVEGLTDTHVVRLSWFDTLPAGLLTAISADGHRVDLLTVPPHTDENAAWAAMRQAAQTGNLIHTPDILAPITTPATQTPRTRTETAQESGWESEGGRLRDHEA